MIRAGLHHLPLAVTMGDPAGIGLDIVLLAWRDRIALGLPSFFLCADPDAVTLRSAEISVPVKLVEIATAAEITSPPTEGLPILPVRLRMHARAGEPDVANASAIIGAIEKAVEAVALGTASAVVTNPIAKHVLYHAGFAHPGHTEFLATLAERHVPGERYHPVMMLASDALRVVPLTVHLPLAAVPSAITANLITRTAQTLHAALIRDFGIARPRIAVAGLNPHAGESGSLGTEDRDIIAPAIAALRQQGLEIRGPLSADTLFHASARQSYDAVLAMYHDQALIPIKTLAFDEAVNVTLGLPFVRTSPDHGTAFDIAGRGTASPASLIAAMKLADKIAANRLRQRG